MAYNPPKSLKEIEKILRKNLTDKIYDLFKHIFEEGIEKYTYRYPEVPSVYGNKEYAAWHNYYLKIEKEPNNLSEYKKGLAMRVLGVILEKSVDTPMFYFLG